MPVVFFVSRLKEGVTPEAYEKWLVEFDYVKAGQVPSILSYRTHRIQGHLGDGAPKPFDYLEVLEVTDIAAYLREAEEHPAMQAVKSQWGDYVEAVHVLHGEFIPPGVRRP